MSVVYKNDYGEVYTLYEGVTKTGKPRYFFSSKEPTKEFKVPDSIPDGYEIFEKANSGVFLRKTVPCKFLPAELKVLERAIREFNKSGNDNIKIEIKGKTIEVMHAEGIDIKIPGELGRLILKKLKERKSRNYSAVYKIEVQEAKKGSKRQFHLSRWHFSGDEGWMYVDSLDDIKMLVWNYFPKIGSDEYFEIY
ncbi:MAG: hypothetical protein NUW37_09715 [Planctomycetes bacterium]|nr:hypothetical protein [Planctomycetota bacterium]